MNAYVMTIPADLPRRTFTVRDVERMAEIGVLAEDEHIELIFGELIPMSPKGARHETVKRALLECWFKIRPSAMSIMPETTLRLSLETYIEPDFVIFPSEVRTADLKPNTLLLAVEIADSSLEFELGTKAQIYAHFGIRELWVIDAERSRIHVHRDPENDRYTSITTFDAGDLVIPTAVPSEFALRLTELDIESL